MTLTEIFRTEKTVIGMVHLDPLPGAPKNELSMESIVENAVRDATRLETGGVDGIIIENFGDAPFYPDNVPKHTVASMTQAASAIAQSVSLPLGINVLRNDPIAAVSVAAAVDASYVRVNVHTGARVTDQGVIEGMAHETMRLRERLNSDISVFADVDVKHSAPLAAGEFTAETFADQTERGLADAAIISGTGTGHAADMDTLKNTVRTREELGLETPILVGSGVTPDSIGEILSIADGAIVGTSIKEGGLTTAPVAVDRVRLLVKRADEQRTANNQ